MNIYTGNLGRDVSEEDLRQAFQTFGKVESVTLIKDKFTGESRGYAFIEMQSTDEAQAAIDGLNGKELKGRTIVVNQARPREERRPGRGSGRGGGGGRRW